MTELRDARQMLSPELLGAITEHVIAEIERRSPLNLFPNQKTSDDDAALGHGEKPETPNAAVQSSVQHEAAPDRSSEESGIISERIAEILAERDAFRNRVKVLQALLQNEYNFNARVTKERDEAYRELQLMREKQAVYAADKANRIADERRLRREVEDLRDKLIVKDNSHVILTKELREKLTFWEETVRAAWRWYTEATAHNRREYEAELGRACWALPEKYRPDVKRFEAAKCAPTTGGRSHLTTAEPAPTREPQEVGTNPIEKREGQS